MSIEKTPNYNLNKPGYDNFGDIVDLNENADIIDTTLQNKVDKEVGKGLSETNFTNSEKSSLRESKLKRTIMFIPAHIPRL